MFVTKHFLSYIVDKHGRQPVSIDGGTWYSQQACRFLELDHHLHSSVYKDEKSVIGRPMQYIKNRTMNVLMNDYFPCIKKKCKLEHVKNCLNLFVDIITENYILSDQSHKNSLHNCSTMRILL
jgi:putative transposase